MIIRLDKYLADMQIGTRKEVKELIKKGRITAQDVETICTERITNRIFDMINYLAIMMTVSSILCIRSKSKENLEKKKELWEYLKKKDLKTFIKIRYGILGQILYFQDFMALMEKMEGFRQCLT